MPAWGARLLTLLVPADHHEAFLGDVAEEYARRRRRCPRSARQWIVREAIAGVWTWTAFRGAGAFARELVSVPTAFLVALGAITSVNRTSVLAWVTTLEPGTGARTALAMNLLAVSLGGGVLRLVAGRPSGRAAALLVLTVLAYPWIASGSGLTLAAGRALRHGGPDAGALLMASIVWTVCLAAAVGGGAWCGGTAAAMASRRGRVARPGPPR